MVSAYRSACARESIATMERRAVKRQKLGKEQHCKKIDSCTGGRLQKKKSVFQM